MASGTSQPMGDPASATPTSTQSVPKDREEKETEVFQDFLNSPPVSPSKAKLPDIPVDSSKVQPDVSSKNPPSFDPAKSAFHKSLFVLGAGNPPASLGVRPLSPVMSDADVPPTVEKTTTAEEVPSAETSGTSLRDSFSFVFSYLAGWSFNPDNLFLRA